MFEAIFGGWDRGRGRVEGATHVEPGASYRATQPQGTAEIARVLAVADDGQGIPHVRYDMEVQRAGTAERPWRERRTLTLDAFRDRYCEALPRLD